MWAWMGSWQGEHWLMGRVWPPLLLLTQIQKHCRHKYISKPWVQCKKQYNNRKYKKTVGVWHFKVPCVQCSGSTYWSHRFLSETRDTKAALFGDGNVDKSLLILSEKQKSCVLLYLLWAVPLYLISTHKKVIFILSDKQKSFLLIIFFKMFRCISSDKKVILSDILF